MSRPNEETLGTGIPRATTRQRRFAMGWSILQRIERVKAERREEIVRMVRGEYAWSVACSTLVERLLAAIFLRGMGEKDRAWRKGYVDGWCDAMRQPRKGER